MEKELSERAKKAKATKEANKLRAAEEFQHRRELDALNKALGLGGIKEDANSRLGYSFYPIDPTISFEVGEEVKIGNLKNCIVMEVHPSKLAYKVQTDSSFTWWNWTEIYKNDVVHQAIPFSRGKNILGRHLEQLNTVMHTLIHSVYHQGCIMDPWFQRDLVWNEEDKIMLLDSVFSGIDIGKFVFANRPYAVMKQENDYRRLVIIDGKQRLNTLIEFYEGRILYNGCSYKDLHPEDKYTFDQHRIVEIHLSERMYSEENMLNQFYYMNIAGRPVNSEHLKIIKSRMESQ